ncbi:hypothetical protein ACFY41_06585 [Streptomyces syringium]|uniref:hypothetical protein n=1 Tax=Streptomyces syringium TaxID=76729 RepID=UPI0036B79505
MPRKPPARIRPGLPRRPRGHDRPGRVVPGLSAPAQRQTADYENVHDRPGGIADAVSSWSRTVHGMRRHASEGDWSDDPDYPCCSTSREARILLEEALHALPPRAARELRAVVAPLDALFLDRVLPDQRYSEAPDWWIYTHHRKRY